MAGRDGRCIIHRLRNGRFDVEVRLWEYDGDRAHERWGDVSRDFATEDEARASGERLVAAWVAGRDVPLRPARSACLALEAETCAECGGTGKCALCGGTATRDGRPCPLCHDISDIRPGLCRGCRGKGKMK
jgi:hypothetical protein